MNSRIIKNCNRAIFFGVLVLVLFLPLALNFRLADTFDLAKTTLSTSPTEQQGRQGITVIITAQQT